MSQLSRAIVIALVALALAGMVTACSGARAARSQAPPKARASAAKATETFGLARMGRLPKGNLAFSPDSVAAALAMIGTGAAGATETQIAHVLHLRSPASFTSLGALQRTIVAEQARLAHGDSEAPELSIANGMFLQQGYPLQPPFAAGLQQAFGAAPQTVDFMNPTGTEAINAWISQETNGLIPQIVEGLSPETRLALANATYLKARWSERFKPNGSKPGTFHGEAGATSTVFMHKTESLSYARARGYAALSLRYLDSTLSLLVLLPEGQSLSNFERHLDPMALERIVRALSRRNVYVSLPRLHLHTQTLLNGPLQQLGVTERSTKQKRTSRA